MKRALWILIPLLLLGALLLWGNALVARTLDAELPALLSRVLHVPVRLAPVQVRLTRLQAHSDELVLGAPDSPAVHARAVTVRLSLPALLSREIRLAFAAADELTVQPARWPRSGKPRATHYRFLDRWLPGELMVQEGRYVRADGAPYPLADLRWSRDDDRAELRWTEQRAGGELSVQGQLVSLSELLALSSLQLSVQTELADAADTALDAQISITPGTPDTPDDGYRLDATLAAGGTQAHWLAGASEPWRWPAWSELDVDQLVVSDVWALVKQYRRAAPDPAAATFAPSLLSSNCASRAMWSHAFSWSM